MLPPSNMISVLLLVLPTATLGTVTFSKPVSLGAGQWTSGRFWQLGEANGTQQQEAGAGRGVQKYATVIGADNSGWWTSTDGGNRWKHTFTNASHGPNTSFTPSFVTKSGNGYVRQSLGNLTRQTLAYNATAPYNTHTNYTHFVGANPERMRLDPKTGEFSIERIEASMSISGIPAPGLFRQLRFTGVSSIAQLPDGSLLLSVMTYLPPPHQNPQYPAISTYSLLALGSTDGGLNWEYRGIIASPQGFPMAEEGPSENALTVIEGTSRVVCVFRLDGGDGAPYHQMLPYGIAFSDDFGTSWSAPKMLPSGNGKGGDNITVGCACPQLTSLPGGGLLLAGGRPNSHSLDPMVWFNHAGDGEVWEPYSISYHHNLGCNYTGPTNWNDTNITDVFRFNGGVNSSGRPRQSTSYTSLVRTSTTSAVLVYSQWLHHMGNQWRAYAMPFQWTN